MDSETIQYDGRVTHVRKVVVYADETGAEEIVQHRIDVAVVSDDVPDIPGELNKVNHRTLYNQVLDPPGLARIGDRVLIALKKKGPFDTEDKWVIQRRPE